MSDIRIKKNVPMPKMPQKAPWVPLEYLEVGHCVELHGLTESNKNALRQRLTRFHNSNPPKQFTMHSIDVPPRQDQNLISVRIHRIEDNEQI